MEIYIHAKHVLNKFTKTLILLILLILPFAALAQTVVAVINSRIEGRVIDSVTKQPIAGVTLRIKSVTHEVSTGPMAVLHLLPAKNYLIRL